MKVDLYKKDGKSWIGVEEETLIYEKDTFISFKYENDTVMFQIVDVDMIVFHEEEDESEEPTEK